MANAANDLLSYMRAVSGAWRDDPRDDAELLACFAESGNDIAFRILFWRHGPVVWRVCRRILGDSSDAEDALQVVFLTMARKAGKLRARTLVGWLHQVARRVALNTQDAVHRRRKLENQIHTSTARRAEVTAPDAELHSVLDEELANLPERLRIPLILRHLEGKSQDEVAGILGCSRSVARKRLERGETMLRERLTKRGLGTVAVADLLTASTKAPAVPLPLMESTTLAAVAFRSGVLTGVAADGARKLLRSLTIKRVVLKLWWMALVCVGTLGVGGAGLVAWKMSGGGTGMMGPETAVVPPVSKSADKPHKERVDIYGDPLPEGALARLGTVRLRDTKISLTPVSFMPNGKAFVALSDDRLSLWEFPTGKLLLRLDALEDSRWGSCNSIAVSADAKLMAIATGDGSVALVDLSSGGQVGRLKADNKNEILALAFLPGDKILVSGMSRDKTVRFWNVETGKEIRRQKVTLSDSEQAIGEMAFSPNGRIVAVGQKKGLVWLFDLESGNFVGDMKMVEGRSASIESLAFSVDGRKLTTMEADGWIKLWEVATRKVLLKVRGCAGVSRQHPPLSPDGKILAAMKKDGEVNLWDVKNGACLRTLAGPPGFAYRMIFSQDSKALVTGGMTQTLKLWDVSTGKALPRPVGHEYMVNAIAFSPDGKSLASRNGILPGDSSTLPILIWDVETCKLRHQQIERKTGEVLLDMLDISRKDGGLKYSSDGTMLASVGRDGKDQGAVWLWDAITGMRVRTLINLVRNKDGVDEGMESLDFSPDCKVLAIGSYEKTVGLYEVATGRQLCTLEAYDLRGKGEQGIATVVFSPDGRKLASIHQAGIALWDATTGLISSLQVSEEADKHEPSMSSVVFSRDGKMLVCGGNTDKAIRFWEIASGQERLKIPLEDGSIQVAISPDGRLVASASEDETIRLWDAITGRRLHQFPRGQGRVRALAFAPDGKTLASGNEDTTVLIWNVAEWVGRISSPVDVPSEEIQASWSALAAGATKAYRAIWKLVAASDQAIPLLAEQLRPTVSVSTKRLAQLIADIDSDDFQIRNRGRKELREMGNEAEPFLRQALKNKLTPEQRQIIEKILYDWNKNGMAQQSLQKLRALEVLEHMDTVASRRVLQELAESSRLDKVGDEARAALQRLNRQPR